MGFYIFHRVAFADDVAKFTRKTSTRHMSEMTGNRVASTTISRIQTRKTKEVTISVFLELCHVMQIPPTDYLVEIPF